MVREWEMPESWDALITAHNRVMTKEATIYYGPERARFPHLLSPSLSQSLEVGDAVSRPQLADAKKRRKRAQADVAGVWEKFDLLLVPAARGEAPMGLGSTGDPIFKPLLDVPRPALHRAALQQRAGRPAAVGAAGRSSSRRRPADQLGALGRAATVVMVNAAERGRPLSTTGSVIRVWPWPSSALWKLPRT